MERELASLETYANNFYSITTFFEDEILLTRVFSAGFVSSSLHKMQTAVSWDPKKSFASELKILMRLAGKNNDARFCEVDQKQFMRATVRIRCLIDISWRRSAQESFLQNHETIFGSVVSRRNFTQNSFTLTEASEWNFSGQSIASLHQTTKASKVALNFLEVRMKFFKSSIELFSKFFTTCI